MPLDIGDTGDEGGEGHECSRKPRLDQRKDISLGVDDYVEEEGLCTDCTLLAMGVDFLTHLVMRNATECFSGPTDRLAAQRVREMIRKRLDTTIDEMLDTYEGRE